MAKLSIIVPVYKTEKYINRCFNSILCQEFQDFELILVDDGSPDKCPQICDEYEKKDSRVKVIHKQNAGVAAARNTGLNIASGEYITFVDSDDWLDANMYEDMMNVAIKYNCDVVMCDCVKEFLNKTEIYSHNIREGFYDYEQLKSEYYQHLIMMENVEYPPTISNCLCLIKKEVLKDNIRYIEGIRFSEDLLFGAEFMFKSRSFYYMKNKTYYHYVIHSSSATQTYAPDKWYDYVILYAEAKKFFGDKEGYDFGHQIDLMLLFFVYNVIGDIRGRSQMSKSEKNNKIQTILKEPIVRQMFKRVSVHKLKISWKLKVYTYLYKFRLGQKLVFYICG